MDDPFALMQPSTMGLATKISDSVPSGAEKMRYERTRVCIEPAGRRPRGTDCLRGRRLYFVAERPLALVRLLRYPGIIIFSSLYYRTDKKMPVDIVAVISVSAAALVSILNTLFTSRCTRINTCCISCDRTLADETPLTESGEM